LTGRAGHRGTGKQHTASQRAMIANSLLPFYQSEAKERQKLSEGRGAKGVQKVAPVKAREAAGQITSGKITGSEKQRSPNYSPPWCAVS
jgi:hypothetical protein